MKVEQKDNTVQPDGKLHDDLRVHRNIALSIERYSDEYWVHAINTGKPFFLQTFTGNVYREGFWGIKGVTEPCPVRHPETPRKFFHSRFTGEPFLCP